jgi:hypothetical protein
MICRLLVGTHLVDVYLPSNLPSGLGDRENVFHQKILHNFVHAKEGIRIFPPQKNVGHQLLLVCQQPVPSRNSPRMEGCNVGGEEWFLRVRQVI